MYGNFDGLFTGLIVICLLAGVAIGAFLFWLLPLLWAWVKPWIHAVTG